MLYLNFYVIIILNGIKNIRRAKELHRIRIHDELDL